MSSPNIRRRTLLAAPLLIPFAGAVAGSTVQVPASAESRRPAALRDFERRLRPAVYVLAVEAGELTMRPVSGTRSRPLAPVAPGRFVRPEWRGPPGVLQVDLKRGVDGQVSGLVLTDGDGRLFYARDPRPS